MRTASIEVKKFSSRRAAPVFVSNKQRRRGDKDGCCSQKQQKLVMSKIKDIVTPSVGKMAQLPVPQLQQWQEDWS